jgi:hypothetical protein
MTEQESMVLSEVNSVPGLTIQLRFDSEYFYVGRFFMVEQWNVALPREKGGKYERKRLVRTFPAMVTGLERGGTVLNLMEIDPESGGIRYFSFSESEYRHGYWCLEPAKIEKERKNDDG